MFVLIMSIFATRIVALGAISLPVATTSLDFTETLSRRASFGGRLVLTSKRMLLPMLIQSR